MRKRLAKVAAAMTVAALATGNTTSMALAYESDGVQQVWCYGDGSCDVDGVCVIGGVCDGSHSWCYDSGTEYHHEEPHHNSGSGHHGGGHHSGRHH